MHDMADSRDEPIGNTVAEGYKDHGHEGWECVADVLPIDGYDLTDHKAADLVNVLRAASMLRHAEQGGRRETYNHQRAAGSPRRDRSEDGGEEDRNQEATASR